MLSGPLRIITALSEVSPEKRIAAKKAMAEFARAQSEYHQQRADYWYRVQTQADAEACEIEDGEIGGRE